MNEGSQSIPLPDAACVPDNDFFPPFTRGEMMERRRRVTAGMKERELDALVVWGGFGIVFGISPGQTNLCWLANYAACMQGYLVVSREGELTLILRLGYHVQNARDLTFIDDIRAHYEIDEFVAKRLKELGVERGRIGIVGPHRGRPATRITIPVEHHRTLERECPGVTLLDATEWYELLRFVRSEEELAVLRRAGALGDSIYAEMMAASRPGVSNRDLRRLVNRRCVEEGATYVFCHIGSFAMADPASAYPDYYPSERTIRGGDVLMTELCVGYGFYWNKIWGTWFCGEPTKLYRTMFEDARQIHDFVFATAKPGLRGVDFDPLAEVAAEKGYDLQYPVIVGWSAINHDPELGAVPGTAIRARIAQYDDWVLRTGETYTLVGWIAKPGTKHAVWVGSSGAVTAEGFQRFNGDAVTGVLGTKGSERQAMRDNDT